MVWYNNKFETSYLTSVLKHNNVKYIFDKIMSAEFSLLNITCVKQI